MSGDGRLERAPLAFERNFTQVPNEWLRDKRLSLRAIGLLAQLMSHEVGYTVTFKALARVNREGDAALRSAVAELKEAGYLEIERLRDLRGTIVGSIWRLTDPAEVAKRKRSQPALPGLGEPRVDSPRVDSPRLKEAHLQEDSLSGPDRANPSTRAGTERTSADALDAIWEVCPVTHGDHHFDPDHGWCTNCAQANADGGIRDVNGHSVRGPQPVSA